MSRAPVEIVCEVRFDNPRRKSIGVADGTDAPDPNVLGGTRPRIYWIPRSQILDCDPPLDSLPCSGPRLVTLTIPEWLAKNEGLI